jgi:hypothetical protein
MLKEKKLSTSMRLQALNPGIFEVSAHDRSDNPWRLVFPTKLPPIQGKKQPWMGRSSSPAPRYVLNLRKVLP